MNLDLNRSLTQKPFGRFLINIQVIKKKTHQFLLILYYEYFKNLNHYDTDDNDVALDIDFNSICDNPLYDTILNDEITEEELLDAI